jgi:uncharacterized protein (UPF0333 family)
MLQNKAQAGLEYLMTYGWALVIIVVVAGMLFFVMATPTQSINFNSTTRDIIIRSSNVTTDAPPIYTIELQNTSGKNITLTAITPTNLIVNSPYDDCTQPSCSIPITSGQIIKITGTLASGYSSSGDISIQYTIDTYAKTATISANGTRPPVTTPTCADMGGSCQAPTICSVTGGVNIGQYNCTAPQICCHH